MYTMKVSYRPQQCVYVFSIGAKQSGTQMVTTRDLAKIQHENSQKQSNQSILPPDRQSLSEVFMFQNHFKIILEALLLTKIAYTVNSLMSNNTCETFGQDYQFSCFLDISDSLWL